MKSDPYYGSSVSVEWYTPRYLIDGVLAVLGAIDCDPCSNPPPYNVPATVHYTRDDDGLSKEFKGRVFMNPPFGKSSGASSIETWLRKLAAERHTGHVTAAISLQPSRTEARWFRYVWQADAVCFLYGRVDFIGSKASGNTTGTTLAYYGPACDRFAAVFGALGQVIFPPAPVAALAAYQPLLWQVGA